MMFTFVWILLYIPIVSLYECMYVSNEKFLIYIFK